MAVDTQAKENDADPRPPETKELPQKTEESRAEAQALKTEEPRKVDVEDFKVFRDAGENLIKVQFKLINTGSDSKPVSGYTFVALKDESDNQENQLVLPRGKLISGKPSRIKNGRYFSILRFKTVKYQLKDLKDPRRFKDAAVMVFTPSGDLLLEKSFPVKIQSDYASSTSN